MEQLKAELVVFKGLMSNVSAAPGFPEGQSETSEARGAGPSSVGLLVSHPRLLPFFLLSFPFPPSHP